jgi:hypothetical protein
MTSKWTPQRFAESDKRERRMVYAHFDNADEGRSRVLVAKFEKEEDAILGAAAPDMLDLLRQAVYRDVDRDDDWYDKASSLVLRLDGGRKLPEKEQKG